MPAQKNAPKAAKAPKKKILNVPFWIGFDLGDTKMMATVLDKNYKVLGSARKSTNGSDGQLKCKQKILKAIHAADENAGGNP